MYEKFQALLLQKDVKPYAVSKATGIGASTFSDWKTGRSIPKLDKLQKIADYFGVPVEYFTDGPEQPKSILDTKIPKDLRRILEDEAVTLNGRLMSEEDKEKMYRIIEAAFYEAKEMNRRKK